MWEPWTRRILARAALPITSLSTCSTHGPAALIRARALMVSTAPEALSASLQDPFRSIAESFDSAGSGADHGASVSSIAGIQNDEISASSTLQSEYSKPSVNERDMRGRANGPWVRSTDWLAGSRRRAPR